MKNKLQILCFFSFITLLSLSAFSQEAVISRSELKINQLENVITQQQDEIDSLKASIAELRIEKNNFIDEALTHEVKMLSLAAVLTLVSLFLILFVFMYLSIRRRRRLEVEELNEKLA